MKAGAAATASGEVLRSGIKEKSRRHQNLGVIKALTGLALVAPSPTIARGA
jgi:hypothetical protein